MEKLLGTVTLPLYRDHPSALIVDLEQIRGHIERASLSQRERKSLKRKLSGDFEKSHERAELWDVLLALYQRGIALPTLLRVSCEFVSFSFTEDPVRFQHVAGLADAVSLSMLNLGVSVKFPFRENVKARSVDGGRKAYRSVVRFKNGNINEPYRSFNRLTTRNRRLLLMKHYLKQFPVGTAEKDIVKRIKQNLVDTFCIQAGQSRPKQVYPALRLFPNSVQARLDRRFSTDRRGKIRFYKNLLESKSLCAPVGQDMIDEAYASHRASLCRPENEVLDVPHEFLRGLYEYGKRVGQFIETDYDPHVTKLPNKKATVEKSRFKGGAREALAGRLEVQKGPLYLSLLDGHNRPEPLVVGLFGPPGCGKTTSVNRLVAALGRRLFPDRKGRDLLYARSCSTQFWDGYEQQPIVILDDLGQNVADRHDLVEFEQLVSSNRYIVPMAHLEKKGMEFTSPIIICTSNMEFNSRISPPSTTAIILEDDRAFWRRFHFPIRVFRDPQPHLFTEKPLLFADQPQEGEAKKARFFRMKPRFYGLDEDSYGRALGLRNLTAPSSNRSYVNGGYDHKFTMFEFVDGYEGTLELLDGIVSQYRRHVDFHAHTLTGEWRQTIHCLGADVQQSVAPFYEFSLEKKAYPDAQNDLSISLLYPEFPPHHPPVVEAVAIPEPLKVRMITKAEATTKVLQPFQRSLFRYLKTQPQFVLTHGVSWGSFSQFDEKLEWIYRIEGEIKAMQSRRKEGDLWLSGDYTAATDNFPLSVTNALVEGILSEISHEPTRAWVRYEVSPHRIRYPELESGLQTSGQLMGSLISFPLLCFLNDFIVGQHFESGKYLINGDDVVALGPLSSINNWSLDAPKVGLDLSMGKNFIDPNFCCVNSQLFYDAVVQHTGKVSCQTRYGKSLSFCFQESQFYYGDNVDLRHEFIRRNIVELRKTPRSLLVPTTHGGLGLFFAEGEKLDASLARRVYINSFLKPFLKSTSVPGFDYLRAMAVPVGIFDDSEVELGGGLPPENDLLETLLSLDTNPPDPDDSPDMSHSSLNRDEKIYQVPENTRLLNQLKSSNFRDFPPLSHLRYRTVFVQKGRVGFFKAKVIHLALQTLLSYIRSDWAYDPEENFVEIHREFLEEQDPIFGSLFSGPTADTPEVHFEDDEQQQRDSAGVFESIPERIYPWTSLRGPVWNEIFALSLPPRPLTPRDFFKSNIEDNPEVGGGNPPSTQEHNCNNVGEQPNLLECEHD